MIVDQAAISAGFDFQRYATKLTPAKPRIIIAHVEGDAFVYLNEIVSLDESAFCKFRSAVAAAVAALASQPVLAFPTRLLAYIMSLPPELKRHNAFGSATLPRADR
jgi:hypothetical protein